MAWRRTNNNVIKCTRFLIGCKKEIWLIILMSLSATFISIFIPAITGNIINTINNYKYSSSVIYILLFILLNVVFTIFLYFLNDLYLVVRQKFIFNIRSELIKSVLNLEMFDVHNNHSGMFLNKIKNDPNEMIKSLNSIRILLITGFGNVGSIIYIFVLDYRIGILLILFSLLIFMIKYIGIRKSKKHKLKSLSHSDVGTSVIDEMVNGVNDIKTLNIKRNYVKKIESPFVLATENSYKSAKSKLLYNKVAKFMQFVAMGIILLLGLYLVKMELMDTSVLLIICMYNSYVFSFVDKLGLLTSYCSSFSISCNRIFSLLDYKKVSYGSKYSKKCSGKIEFDLVKFRYNDNLDYVLTGCSFLVNSNEFVGIIGKSGEGKTTILNLIARLYDVSDGSIKIDGINVNEYNEKFIRENISLISQNSYLFDMSIKENLRLSNKYASDLEIREVCKQTCLDEWIQTLPEKYDTILGEGGVKLSGGQKQRLAIARALLKKTKIILLDEITSSLDNDTGSVIKQVINNIKKEHTIIMVTHELSMIKDCSRILVLDNGKIVGDGTHEELLSNNKTYKNLYKIK